MFRYDFGLIEATESVPASVLSKFGTGVLERPVLAFFLSVEGASTPK
jgi:hypothetical protein